MSDTKAPRSLLKKGIDENCSRKLREERTVQIRKDKRLDRTNMQRRRYQEEDDAEERKKFTSSMYNGLRRNLDNLPVKAAELLSDNRDVVLESAMYFRKVLAMEKCPPVDAVVAVGIVPRLVELLKWSHEPKIQLEAAWSVTNIACAEVPHAQLLIHGGAIPVLIELIANSPVDGVREQALWALGNISADVNDCRDLLLHGGIIQPMMWQLGLGDCPPHRRNGSPSLSTMQHVTWLCSNLSRGTPPPPIEAVQMIIGALAELLQSPDEVGLTIYFRHTQSPPRPPPSPPRSPWPLSFSLPLPPSPCVPRDCCPRPAKR